jgi:hypothetical protein
VLALAYVRGGFDSFTWRIWPAIAMIFFQLAILVAVALLISSFSSPALSALLSSAVFIIGHFSSDMRMFADDLGSNAARFVFNLLFYLLPNFSNLTRITATGHGDAVAMSDLFAALLYTALYASVLIAATVLIFKRRNFK